MGWDATLFWKTGETGGGSGEPLFRYNLNVIDKGATVPVFSLSTKFGGYNK